MIWHNTLVPSGQPPSPPTLATSVRCTWHACKEELYFNRPPSDCNTNAESQKRCEPFSANAGCPARNTCKSDPAVRQILRPSQVWLTIPTRPALLLCGQRSITCPQISQTLEPNDPPCDRCTRRPNTRTEFQEVSQSSVVVSDS